MTDPVATGDARLTTGTVMEVALVNPHVAAYVAEYGSRVVVAEAEVTRLRAAIRMCLLEDGLRVESVDILRAVLQSDSHD